MYLIVILSILYTALDLFDTSFVDDVPLNAHSSSHSPATISPFSTAHLESPPPLYRA